MNKIVAIYQTNIRERENDRESLNSKKVNLLWLGEWKISILLGGLKQRNEIPLDDALLKGTP